MHKKVSESPMNNYRFWSHKDKNSNNLLMNPQQILSYNKNNFRNDSLKLNDIANAPQSENILFGFVCVKSYIFEQPSINSELLSSVNIWESIIAYPSNQKNNFIHITTKNCVGFVNKDDIAFCSDRKQWIKFLNPEKFITILASELYVNYFIEKKDPIPLNMGCIVPVICDTISSVYDFSTDFGFQVLLPTRDSYGNFFATPAYIPKSADVIEGFLPYTRANVLKQAFKTYGEPYGFAGINSRRDCSALIADIFSTFGIILPRNSREQSLTSGYSFDLSRFHDHQKISRISHFNPSAVIYFPGHIMLYLGRDGGRHYVFHQVGTLGKYSKSDGLQPNEINCAAISDLFELRYNGKTLIESAEVILEYRI